MTSPHTGYRYLDEVQRRPGSVLAFAHRGGAFHPDIPGLENTVEAFQHAVDLGYDYLETDVHVSRDGVLLAFHDSVLDRVTDRVGPIAALSAREIDQARIGGSARVPRLEELFEAFPDARFNIDIKADGAAPALADFVRAHDAWDRVLVGSFSKRRLDSFRRLTTGRVPTSASPVEVAAYLGAPSGAAARRLTRGRVAALQIPARSGRLPVVTPRLIRTAHRAGTHVHVWTIDDPAEMNRLLDLGVDGLFTDRTDLLKDVLTARGQWREHDR